MAKSQDGKTAKPNEKKQEKPIDGVQGQERGEEMSEKDKEAMEKAQAEKEDVEKRLRAACDRVQSEVKDANVIQVERLKRSNVQRYVNEAERLLASGDNLPQMKVCLANLERVRIK